MRRAVLALLGLSAPLGLPAAALAASGAELYAQNCAVCHQADATGAPGQYPPLKGRVDKIASTPEGQHYLADLLTHGMAGQIAVGSDSYAGFMPAFKQLSDADIASILDWVSGQGTTKPAPQIAESDVAAARGRTMKAAEVAQERQALDSKHPLP